MKNVLSMVAVVMISRNIASGTVIFRLLDETPYQTQKKIKPSNASQSVVDGECHVYVIVE